MRFEFLFGVGVIVVMTSIAVLLLVPPRHGSRPSSGGTRRRRRRGALVLMLVLLVLVIMSRNRRVCVWSREVVVVLLLLLLLLRIADGGICHHDRPAVRAPGLSAGPRLDDEVRPLQLYRVIVVGLVVEVAFIRAGPRPLEAAVSRVRVVFVVVSFHGVGGGTDTLTVTSPLHQAYSKVADKRHGEERGGGDGHYHPRRER